MEKAENTVIFDGIQYDPGDELPDIISESVSEWWQYVTTGKVPARPFINQFYPGFLLAILVLKTLLLIQPEYVTIFLILCWNQ